MRDKLIFMALLLAALLPGILAVSVPSAQAAPAAATAQAAPVMHFHGTKTVADGSRRCTRNYNYSDGLQGLANISFAKAEWTSGRACGTHLEVRVSSRPSAGSSCQWSAHSGSVVSNNIWSEATGAANYYCGAQIRFKCGSSACTWGAWEKLPNTSARQPTAITLTAFTRPVTSSDTFGDVAVQAPGTPSCSGNESLNYSYNQFSPSNVTSHWSANDCGWLQSPELKDNAGNIHYGDSWRSAIGVNSVASSPNAFTNGKAWVREKISAAGQIWCWRIFPTKGTAWFKANGSVC